MEKLLSTLVEVARLTMTLLQGGDPKLEELEALAERRAEVFSRLQEAVRREQLERDRPISPEHQARRENIVGELRKVDEQCVELGRKRIKESRSDWEKAKLLRRTLHAYGWNDPEFAPRGYFVDTVD